MASKKKWVLICKDCPRGHNHIDHFVNGQAYGYTNNIFKARLFDNEQEALDEAQNTSVGFKEEAFAVQMKMEIINKKAKKK